MHDGRHLYSNIIATAYLISFRISLFLSRLDPFLLTYCRCKGLFLSLITLSDTHTQSVGLLWTSDRLEAETSNNTSSSSSSSSSSCSWRVRSVLPFLNPQDEVGPSTSSLVVPCSFVLLVYIVMLVLVVYLCPSSVRVVANFSGIVLFPLLYSVLLFFPPNTLILFFI